MAVLRTLCAAGGLLGLLAPLAAAQLEGPLDNDATLPVSTDAEAELARGDAAFAAALKLAEGDARASAAAWTPVCEAWRNALVRSRGGDSAAPRPVATPGGASPWPTSEGAVARCTEGVEEGVFRRLAALPRAGQLAWSERFSALAQEELAKSGGSPRAAARIERELPATHSAARAALLLAELAFERGETDAARSWLARARRHLAALGLEAPEIAQGIAVRERALPVPPAGGEEPWRRATRLEFVAGRELEHRGGAAQRSRPLGAGPQAGMAFLDGDRALLQTPGALWILAGPKAELRGPFENKSWLAPAGLPVEDAVAPGNGPGWRLDPAAHGSSAVVVAGRSDAFANVLACLDLATGAAEPALRWALAAGPVAPGEADRDDAGEWEFEPGPVWTDGLVFALVRRASGTSGEHELDLRALDPDDGALRWSTYLGKGGERAREQGRFARRGGLTQPAEPLLRAASGIFASAQLGFGALIDPLDGRAVFAVRNRRRPGDQRGWTGWGSTVSDSGATLAWAPADSEHLYVIDARGPGARGTPLVAAPQPLGEAEALVGADVTQALVLARAGARAVLSKLDLESGERVDSVRLAPEEVFTGRALASDQRVLAASDRALYVFDRTADLALLAAPALTGPLPRGGNVWAAGSRVFVLSTRYVEIFDGR